MCFSAPVSFAAGAVLVAGGVAALRQRDRPPAMWPIALIPIGFGLQQIAEGVVWVGVTRDDPSLVTAASKAYLAFAQLVWPAWLPFAASRLETVPDRHKRLRLLAWFGLAFGLNLFVPILLDLPGGELLAVDCADRHLAYRTESLWPDGSANLVYVLLGPLAALVSSNARFKTFMLLLVGAAILAWVVAATTWTSVWCFAAACLSAYVVWWVRQEGVANALDG